MSNTITMIGTGYVGLVTGACLAEIGHHVICVDKATEKIEQLNAGRIPIYEPGLEELVHRNVEAGRLSFSTSVSNSVPGRDAVFICVGTPSDPDTGRANLDYVLSAAAEIGQAADGFTVIVTKSTVPVGTNRRIAEVARARARSGVRLAVASNPEFLREGAAITDFSEPDRVVVGGDEQEALEVMRRIYAPITNATVPFIEVGIETAELIKYAANGFLAIKLSFINEIADLCEAVDADVDEVARGIGLDKRIGAAFLKVGPGWGGSCFPKDTQALLATGQDAGTPLRVISAAIEANASRKKVMFRRILSACGDDLSGKKVAVLGLTFKGQTDDMRESPALDILPALLAHGAEVHAYDPANPVDAVALLPGINIAATPEEAVTGADALAIVTEWREFLAYDLANLAERMRRPIMVDLRKLFTSTQVLAAGFNAYFGIGDKESARGCFARRPGDRQHEYSAEGR